LYWGEPLGSPLYYRRYNMTVEKLNITEINKHDGYSAATKAGNTVWNARSTQKIHKPKENDYDSTNGEKIERLEKKVNAVQDTLEKILRKL
jgi:hypothetical protein